MNQMTAGKQNYEWVGNVKDYIKKIKAIEANKRG